MTNSKKRFGVCRICYHKAFVGYNFGAIACDACTAFFRRTVRMNCEYKCVDIDDACNEVAVREVTSRHACKKCRLDRCFKEGMEARYVREEQKPDPLQQQFREARKRKARIERMAVASEEAQLPMLTTMFKALNNLEYFSKPLGKLRCHGSSEPGERYLTFPRMQRLVEKQLKFFRLLLNQVPVICDLSDARKETIWKNTSLFYHVFDMCYHNYTQYDPTTSGKKCYMFRNVYLEADFTKLIFYSSTIIRNPRHTFPLYPLYLQDITSQLLHAIQYIQSQIYSLLKDVIKTPEDWAVLLFVMLLQKSYSGPQYGRYSQFDVMDGVWKEVNTYYTMKGRDPSAWGNLIFLMSSMEALYKDYAVGVYKVKNAISNSVFPNMESDEKAADCPPVPTVPKTAKVVIISQQ